MIKNTNKKSFEKSPRPLGRKKFSKKKVVQDRLVRRSNISLFLIKLKLFRSPAINSDDIGQ